MEQKQGTIDSSFEINREVYDKFNEEKLAFKTPKGLSREVILQISKEKNEPDWMRDFRLKAFELYESLHLPNWGPNLSKLNFDEIYYYMKPDAKKNSQKWEDVPEDIKNTFEKLGIPEAEKKSLAGVGAQYESEIVYHSLKKELKEKGIIFLDCDEALKQYPELFKKYFMTSCITPSLHKFTALHAAVWSGGTFIYVPKNITLDKPLQAYFRMNATRGGQFEHTLIILEENSSAHYIEGCSAPQYTSSSIHAGCVEIHVGKRAKMRYSSIENWSKNTFNLNTKRAIVHEEGIIEWVNGNLGSGVTMLYPASILKGNRSKSKSVGIAFAGKNQNQDTGSKVIHIGKDTSSTIVSKSISKGGGTTTYRGQVSVVKNATGATSHVVCNALMLDNNSISKTIPYMDIKEDSSTISHEANVGKINEEDLFYLMSRGLNKEEATNIIVSGFIAPIVKSLPLEYAVELNRLIELEITDMQS